MKIFSGEKKSFIGAHRGASAYRPENTMVSFHKALELGTDMLEFDVQLTKDNEIIVFHDFDLERITGKQGMVKDFTYKELKELDVGSWFAAEYYKERIPLFEQLLELAQNKVWLNIELKILENDQIDLVKFVIEQLKAYQMIDQVQIMASNHKALKEVRKYSKGVVTNVITSARLLQPVKYLRELEAQVLNTPLHSLSPELVKEVHNAGYYVHGSFSNDVNYWKILQTWDIDVMDTDMPDVMAQNRLK